MDKVYLHYNAVHNLDNTSYVNSVICFSKILLKSLLAAFVLVKLYFNIINTLVYPIAIRLSKSISNLSDREIKLKSKLLCLNRTTCHSKECIQWH